MTNVSFWPKLIKRGERIAQIVFQKIEPVSLVKVEQLPLDSKRGVRGFGSTGKTQITGGN
jgi:dUTPase